MAVRVVDKPTENKHEKIVYKIRNGVAVEKQVTVNGKHDEKEDIIDSLKAECNEWKRKTAALEAEVETLTSTVKSYMQAAKKGGQVKRFEVLSVDKVQTRGKQARILCCCDIDGKVQDLAILLTIDHLVQVIKSAKNGKNES